MVIFGVVPISETHLKQGFSLRTGGGGSHGTAGKKCWLTIVDTLFQKKIPLIRVEKILGPAQLRRAGPNFISADRRGGGGGSAAWEVLVGKNALAG